MVTRMLRTLATVRYQWESKGLTVNQKLNAVSLFYIDSAYEGCFCSHWSEFEERRKKGYGGDAFSSQVYGPPDKNAQA